MLLYPRIENTEILAEKKYILHNSWMYYLCLSANIRIKNMASYQKRW